MLINSARRMPSIGRRISIEVGDLARRLSAKILGSYIWRYFIVHTSLCCPFTTGRSHKKKSYRICARSVKGFLRSVGNLEKSFVLS